MSGKVDVQADYLSPAALQAEGGPTPGVSCAAGRRVEGGGRRREPAASKLRAADPWNARSVGLSRTAEGCGFSGR